MVERGPRGPRALGVRLTDGRELRARRVVSNADPGVTFGRLLPSWAVPAAARRKTRRTVWSTSCLSAFIGADVDAVAVGLDSGNLWRLDSPDVEGAYRRARAEPLGESPFPLLFLSVSSLKDRTLRPAGVHTLEAFALTPWSTVAAWRDEPSGARSASYEVRKRALGERLLASLETLVPGLRARTRFVEFATHRVRMQREDESAAPGPNNPVGVAWIGLDRPGYGMHGTPDPEKVGRTESHGCFRLANWDAVALLSLVRVGTPVLVEP